MRPHEIIACPCCDLLLSIPEAPEGTVARCSRCNAVVLRRAANSLERTLALAITALILICAANAFPFMTFRMSGDFTETTLLSGVAELYRQNLFLVATLVLVTTVVGPFLHVLTLVYVLLPLRFERRLWGARSLFRALHRVLPWSMLEVFLLGVLVSIVKLRDIGDVVPGVALWSFALVIPAIVGSTVTLDAHLVWTRLERAH